MRYLLTLLLGFQLGATTVYLRTGGPGSFTAITAATNATPIVITTGTVAHGLVAGDRVYIQQVYGNFSANGLRKVAVSPAPTATTFAITDNADVPVAGNGAWTFGGYVGKVSAYTIVAHPRMLLDGPSGAMTALMTGNPTKSLRADSSDVRYQGLTFINNAHIGDDTNPSIANTNYAWESGSMLLAEGWFMDRSQTSWRDTAKWMINNWDRRMGPGTSGISVYQSIQYPTSFGRGSDLDWASTSIPPMMYAYSMLYDQFTPTERQNFANKLLNNAGDLPGSETCTQTPLAWQTGTISMTVATGGYYVDVVGVGTHFTTLGSGGATAWAYLPPSTKANTVPLAWVPLGSTNVIDDTHMTITYKYYAPTVQVVGATLAVPSRRWQAGDCGWRWYAREHTYSPMYDRFYMNAKLAHAISGVVTYAFTNSFSVGYNHFITIGGNTYSYAQQAGDTAVLIATTLANLVNASDPIATATLSGASITLKPISGATTTNCSASDGNSATVLNGTGDIYFSVVALPPKTPPYLLVNQGAEFMLVTAHQDAACLAVYPGSQCLTVSRSQWGSAAASAASGKVLNVADTTENWVTPATLNPGLEGVPYDDPRHNLVLTKVYGYMAVGLALADDDERARLMFEQIFNYWYDYIYPADKRAWTGITQTAGNPGYNRRSGYNVLMTYFLRNSLSPAVDLTDGSWLKSMMAYHPALNVPGIPPSVVNGNIGSVFYFADSGFDGTIAIRHMDAMLLDMLMYPTDPLATKLNYWWRTKQNMWVAGMFNSIYAMELPAYGLLLPGATETQIGQTNYTLSDPPHWVFNSVDLADARQYPIGLWSSKTDFTETATHVMALSIMNPTDHIGVYPGPGEYNIIKAGVSLAGDGGEGLNNHGDRKYSNILLTGGASTPGTKSGGPIDRNSGDTDYAYIRVNNSNLAYAASMNVLRAYRHLLHVKGAVDTIFAYDDMATSSSTAKTESFWFYSNKSELPTFVLSGCKATSTRATSVARIVTNYVLPAGATCSHPTLPGKTYSYEGNPYNLGEYPINQLIVDGGSASAINVLAVSKAFSDTTSDLATTTVITTASTHDGVQVAGSNPVVALFPKNATTPAVATSFVSTHSGTAMILVTGMNPGNYSLTINSVAQPAKVANSAGVIKLTGTAGTYALTNTDAPVPLSIGTTTVPDGTLSISYFTQLLGVGGVVPYTWAISAGALPTGLNLNSSTGVISGTPTVIGPFSFTAQLTDGASTVVTQALSMNIGAGVTPVGITSTSPNPAVLSSGSVTIGASTLGGTAPFAWTLPVNTAGCSPITGSGNSFSTTCTQAGDVDILVTDNTAATADIPFSVIFLQPPTSLTITGKYTLRLGKFSIQ